MKRIFIFTLMLLASAISFAQTSDSPENEMHDLQKISSHIYNEYHHLLQHVVDSVLFHANLDSLNCLVFDEVVIRADGTTEHTVKAKSDNEKVNAKIEKSLKERNLPPIYIFDEAARKETYIDVSASYIIVCNAIREWDEYTLTMKDGAREWEEGIDEDMLKSLKRFARIAFYGGDVGNFRLRLCRFMVNSQLRMYDMVEVYRIRKKKDEFMICYDGSLLSGYDLYATPVEKESEKEFPENHVRPSFMGGDANKFSMWVNRELVYPQYAKNQGIMGQVLLEFTVNKEGSVGKVLVKESVHPLLDRESYRVVSSSPDWKPGTIDGEAVNVSYTFPTIYQLRLFQ